MRWLIDTILDAAYDGVVGVAEAKLSDCENQESTVPCTDGI